MVCAFAFCIAAITGQAAGGPVAIEFCAQFAGAVCSVRWKGKEFLDSADHGREMQSASSFDGFGECLNPTEAGSATDGRGTSTTSVLLKVRQREREVETESRMAFWLRPGSRYPNGCGGNRSVVEAQNATLLSNDRLLKKVALGAPGIGNAISYDVAFEVAEAHRSAVFEVLTGYMPPEFSRFHTFDPATGRVDDVRDERPGEQPLPLIFSTPDERFAMGIYAPGLSRYGKFRFNGVVKWNCVSRNGEIRPGRFAFRCYVFVGSVEQVRLGMVQALHLPGPGASER